MKTTSSESKYYLGRPGKGLITSLCLKNIRRSKKTKKSRFAINNVTLKNISKIIKEFEDLHYEGYVRNRSKNMPSDSYFYLARQLEKCMMRSNFFIGPVRTQMTNTKHMNNYEMSM